MSDSHGQGAIQRLSAMLGFNHVGLKEAIMITFEGWRGNPLWSEAVEGADHNEHPGV